MKRILTVMMMGALLLGVLRGVACDTDPAAESCRAFEDYLATCTLGCGSGWDCEPYYDALDYETQLVLDDCSVCVAQKADEGICGDCETDDGSSCQGLMESDLHVTCTW